MFNLLAKWAMKKGMEKGMDSRQNPYIKKPWSNNDQEDEIPDWLKEILDQFKYPEVNNPQLLQNRGSDYIETLLRMFGGR